MAGTSVAVATSAPVTLTGPDNTLPGGLPRYSMLVVCCNVMHAVETSDPVIARGFADLVSETHRCAPLGG